MIIDHSQDDTAPTGDFEKIYESEIPKVKNPNQSDLVVLGKKINIEGGKVANNL